MLNLEASAQTTRAPRNENRIVTLNCGLGRDSLAMVVLAAEGRLNVPKLGGNVSLTDIDVVVFSDTGNEWPHTYALIDRVRNLVESHGGTFVILKKSSDPSNLIQEHAEPETMADVMAKAECGAYHRRAAIMDDLQSRQTVASLGKGDCTCNHKILPIRRLIQDISLVRFGLNNRQYGHAVRQGERCAHVTIIGIAADETSRLENGGKGPDYVTEAYPLVDMGIRKDDESDILTRMDLDDTRKSGCYMCPFQPPSWWWALSVDHPELYEDAVRYELESLSRNPKMSIGGRMRQGVAVTITETVAAWREKNPAATVAAVLDKTYSRCMADARAMRKAA
jgi:hypothetical protein